MDSASLERYNRIKNDRPHMLQGNKMTLRTPRIDDLAVVNARVLDVFSGTSSEKTFLVDEGRIFGFSQKDADVAGDDEADMVEAVKCVERMQGSST